MAESGSDHQQAMSSNSLEQGFEDSDIIDLLMVFDPFVVFTSRSSTGGSMQATHTTIHCHQ